MLWPRPPKALPVKVQENVIMLLARVLDTVASRSQLLQTELPNMGLDVLPLGSARGGRYMHKTTKTATHVTKDTLRVIIAGTRGKPQALHDRSSAKYPDCLTAAYGMSEHLSILELLCPSWALS